MNRTSRLDGTNDNDRAAAKFIRPPWGLTANELLEMRSTGMTNAAIARSVNTTAVCVERMIGKTPPELVGKAKREGCEKGRRKRAEKQKLTKAVEASARAAPPGSVKYGTLRASVVSLRLEGAICNYEVFPERQSVDICGMVERGINGQIAFSEIEPFIEELLNVTTAIENIGK